MRQPHFLKKNHRSAQPTHAIWVDTETHPEQYDVLETSQHLDFGWAAYRSRGRNGQWSKPQWLRFTTRREFWAWVESKTRPKRKLYLFAHNVSYDAPVLGAFTELPRYGWELDGAIIDGPPTILTWRHWSRFLQWPLEFRGWRLRSPLGRSTKTLVWLDTLNIWRMPLAAIGESLGLPKLTMPAENATAEEWNTYAKRDVQIIMEACVRWWGYLREHDLGSFAPTLAGQALKAFRHRFMYHPIYIDSNETALELARDALHGGRTECYQLGKVEGPVHVLDINSMYPHIMKTERMPRQLQGVYGHVTTDELSAWLKSRCCIADVEISTEQPAYGVVHDGRLVFPVGQFRTTLCTPELQYGLLRGHIKKVHTVAVYLADVLFADYVTFFYGQRLKARAAGDKVAEFNSKILLNSLFGKFGQTGRVYESVGECAPDIVQAWTHIDADNDESREYRALGGLVQGFVREQESIDSHPAIAAHVPSYGRMTWWALCREAGRVNTYYGDTDSLHVNQEGLMNLNHRRHSTRLGALKLEGSFDSAEYRGLKDYSYGNVCKIKGVRKRAGQLNDNTFYQDKFIGLKGLVQRGSLDAPIIRTETKTLTREYLKGEVQPDGRVLPLRLDFDAGRND